MRTALRIALFLPVFAIAVAIVIMVRRGSRPGARLIFEDATTSVIFVNVATKGESAIATLNDVTAPLESAGRSPNIIRVETETRGEHVHARFVLVEPADVATTSESIEASLHKVLPPGAAFETSAAPTSFHFLLTAPTLTGSELRARFDDVASALAQVPGVQAVHSCGGAEEQVIVRVDPHRLAAYGATIDDVDAALTRGAAGDRRAGLTNIGEIGSISIGRVKLSDVANVGIDARAASCVLRGVDTESSVLGTIALHAGSNPKVVGPALLHALTAIVPLGDITITATPLDFTEASGAVFELNVKNAELAASLSMRHGVTTLAEIERREDPKAADGTLVVHVAPGEPMDASARAVALALRRSSIAYDTEVGPKVLRAVRVRILAEDSEGARNAAVSFSGHCPYPPDWTAGDEIRLFTSSKTDPTRLAALGVTADSASRVFAAATGGVLVGEMSADPAKPIDVRLRLETTAEPPESWEAIVLASDRKKAVTLGDVASFTSSSEPAAVLRENGRRYIELRFNFNEQVGGDDLRVTLERVAKETRVPVGVSISVLRD